MNIEDVKTDVIPTNFSEMDMLDYIFARQHSLAEKFMKIEVANGLRHTTDLPVNLHDRYGQAQLKDFFWRTTEELIEADDAIKEHPESPNHALEEIADAMHFLVETYLLVDIKPRDLLYRPPYEYPLRRDKLARMCTHHALRGFIGHDSVEYLIYEVIHSIGSASNCLKQRPWKVSHQLVDVPKFRSLLIPAFYQLIEILCFFGLKAEDIFRVYWLKSEINKFRIRTNY